MVGQTTGGTCPDGLQDKIDTMYADCGGCEEGGVNWDDTIHPTMKTTVESYGCGGAAQAAPLFAAVAAVAHHFLN